MCLGTLLFGERATILKYQTRKMNGGVTEKERTGGKGDIRFSRAFVELLDLVVGAVQRTHQLCLVYSRGGGRGWRCGFVCYRSLSGFQNFDDNFGGTASDGELHVRRFSLQGWIGLSSIYFLAGGKLDESVKKKSYVTYQHGGGVREGENHEPCHIFRLKYHAPFISL